MIIYLKKLRFRGANMLTVFKRPSIVVEAQKAKFKPNIIIQTLIL